MKRDDDRPDLDDEPITPGEQARAEAFGRLVDGLLAGDPLPPAMDSDDRALVETATVVMASSRAIEVAPERARRLVDQALEAAILRKGGGAAASPAVQIAEERAASPASVPPDDSNERSVTDMRVRRRRIDQAARVLPWAVASLAAAAAIVLYVARPPKAERAPDSSAARVELAPAPGETELTHTSRPADPLFGAIPKAERGQARDRIDILFADRMSGYRELSFRRALPEVAGEELP